MVTQNKKIRTFRNVVMTTAAVLAIGGAMAKNFKATTYWFPTNSSGVAQSTSTLHTSNYLGCSDAGDDCIKEYSSYSIVGGQYQPSGTELSSYAKAQ